MIIYNDNELLYYCSENDEFALNILIEKYKPLIAARLNKYNIKRNNYEDFFQECLMVLYKCVQRFRPDRDITFNSYIETSINYCIRNILKKEREYFYNVSLVENDTLDLCLPKTNNYLEDADESIKNKNMEKYEFSEYEVKVIKFLNDGYDIKGIGESLDKTPKSVYNAISRIKGKDPNFNKKENSLFSNLEYDVYRYYVKGFKAKEISLILGLSINTVYNALKRIKLKIK